MESHRRTGWRIYNTVVAIIGVMGTLFLADSVGPSADGGHGGTYIQEAADHISFGYASPGSDVPDHQTAVVDNSKFEVGIALVFSSFCLQIVSIWEGTYGRPRKYFANKLLKLQSNWGPEPDLPHYPGQFSWGPYMTVPEMWEKWSDVLSERFDALSHLCVRINAATRNVPGWAAFVIGFSLGVIVVSLYRIV